MPSDTRGGLQARTLADASELAAAIAASTPAVIAMSGSAARRTVPDPCPIPIDATADRSLTGRCSAASITPATAADATAVTQLAANTLLEFDFEPQISISFATERSLICVTTISYDRSTPGEDQRALACYRELNDRLFATGYPPYRLNVSSMHMVTGSDSYARVLRTLKATFDPAGTLAPGRYQPVADDGVDDVRAIRSSELPIPDAHARRG